MTLIKQKIRIWYDKIVYGLRCILIGYIVFWYVQNMCHAIQSTIKKNVMPTDFFGVLSWLGRKKILNIAILF